MSNPGWTQSELFELWMAANDGQATPAQRQRIDTLVTHNDAAREALIAMAQQQAWMMWHGSPIDSDNVEMVLSQVKSLINDCNCSSDQSQSIAFHLPLSQAAPPFVPGGADADGRGFWTGSRKSWLAFATGFGLATALVVQIARTGFFAPPDEKQSQNVVYTLHDGEVPSYRATLINVANCRWDSTRTTADLLKGSALEPGQSLYLLQGVAGVSCAMPSGGIADLQLEGPTSMMLASEGTPTIKHGKVSAKFTSSLDQFKLDTPLGRIVVPRDASLGITCAAGFVDLHAFNGTVLFEPLWPMIVQTDAKQFRVKERRALHISLSTQNGLIVKHGKADEGNFVSLASIVASRLDIRHEYVQAIQSANPIAYWRFEEQSDDAFVYNIMSDRFHCRIAGEGIRQHLYKDNKSAVCGESLDPYYLITNETFDGVIDDQYSLEAWVKPNHFHHGSPFSFIQWSKDDPASAHHGVLLEICGRAGDMTFPPLFAETSGRIRFLHRNPPGDDFGTSCFSNQSYRPRKWQHIVAMKSRDKLQLYLDGKLVGQAEDPTSFPPGLCFLMARLKPCNSHRQFFGEFDEVAIYNRALSQAEIERHFELAHPKLPASPVSLQENVK